MRYVAECGLASLDTCEIRLDRRNIFAGKAERSQVSTTIAIIISEGTNKQPHAVLQCQKVVI